MYKAEGSVSEDVKMITPIGVVAAELWLPGGLSFADAAVSEGRLRARQAVALGHHSVPAADLEAPPDMAIYAARAALKEAGVDAADLEVACHAWMHYQGHDLWSPAHYIAYELRATDKVVLAVHEAVSRRRRARSRSLSSWAARVAAAISLRPA
jgi:3-oxoacyl-[acyl-carrier-protein] synthase-3